MGQCWGRVLAGKQPGLAGQGQDGTEEQSWGVQDTLYHPCVHSDMGADTGHTGHTYRTSHDYGLQPPPACPQGQRKDEKALLINTDYVQRGDISTQPSTPWVSWPGGSQSPVGHSLSLPAQPGRGAPAPETFGLEPPSGNTAPARVPSQREPLRWHSPMQTFLGGHLCGGQPQGGAGAAPDGLEHSTGNPQRCHCLPAPCPLPPTSRG